MSAVNGVTQTGLLLFALSCRLGLARSLDVLQHKIYHSNKLLKYYLIKIVFSRKVGVGFQYLKFIISRNDRSPFIVQFLILLE